MKSATRQRASITVWMSWASGFRDSADLKPPAELEHVLGIAQRFDISRESAARRYVALHYECIAAVFSRGGRIRYTEKPDGFPRISVWSGDPLPAGTALQGTLLTSLDEVDPGDWLVRGDRYALFAQTLFQEDGFAITLLAAERAEEAEESTWDPPRFRR